MDASASEALFSSSSDTPGQSPKPEANAAASSTEPSKEDKPAVSLASLESEVNQVMGSLRGFWGRASKQVAPALEAVRKDLSAAGMQAKAELERLQAQAAEARAAGNSSSDFASLAMNDAGLGSVGLAPSSSPSLFTPAPTTSAQTSTDQDLDEENPLTAEEKGKGREIQPETTPQQQSLFSRLQASLPANAPTSLPSLASFQSTLSSHVSSNPSLNLDIPALRQTLTSNFQKLQSDLHFSDAEKLAEEYLKKSEGLFREAGTFLQDAVKIIPPDESQGGVSWDGSDVWTLPARSNKLGSSNIVFDQSDAQVAARTGLSASSVRAQRKDALLKQLRSDRSLLMVDPAGEDAEEDVREAWKKWLETDVEGKGGIEGDEWTAKVWEELGPGGEGVEELKAMRDELVPAVLSKEAFWTRYFFRVQQIELDSQRRKALLETAQPADDELFSWDDDDAEPTEPTPTPASATATTSASAPAPTDSAPAPFPTPNVPTVPASCPAPPTSAQSTATSPRDSSEGSYDIVSEQSSTVGGDKPKVKAADDSSASVEKKPEVKEKEAAKEDSDDSDWE